jgi:hypothetical protein
MIRDVGNSLPCHAALIALVFVTGLSSALAQQAGHVAEPAPDVSESTSRPIGERLTDYETMELHLRRYSAAANNAAQLFKQLNQKIQEVSLAAKTVEAKNNTHNRRLLEEKLRQLENMRASFSGQHAQLQSQMQNEYRSYVMLSSNLKVKYDTLQELETKVGSAKAVKEAKEAKETRSTEGKQTKPKDPAAKEGKDAKANEPEIGQELGGTSTGSSAKAAPGSVAGPTLHTIR